MPESGVGKSGQMTDKSSVHQRSSPSSGDSVNMSESANLSDKCAHAENKDSGVDRSA